MTHDNIWSWCYDQFDAIAQVAARRCRETSSEEGYLFYDDLFRELQGDFWFCRDKHVHYCYLQLARHQPDFRAEYWEWKEALSPHDLNNPDKETSAEHAAQVAFIAICDHFARVYADS